MAMAGDRLRASWLATTAALEAVRQEWEQLWVTCPQATPFQSPRWLLPWWKHIGRGTLATIAVRDSGSGDLIGLVPLYIFSAGAACRRQLLPIGAATTDVLEPLFRPGREHEALACVLAALGARDGDWDVLDWPQVPGASALVNMPLPAGWQREVVAGEPSPALALALAATGAGRLPVPAAMAQNVRTARARLARAGAWTIERADADSTPRLLDDLARLHEQRWALRGGTGVLNGPGVFAAHREAAPRLHAAGLLRLYALRLDGTAIAALYCLADPAPARERRWYYYLGGFDPRHACLSPGTVLIAHAIEEAVREGARAFDFLRGGETYKYHWGAVDQPMYTVRLTHARAMHSA